MSGAIKRFHGCLRSTGIKTGVSISPCEVWITPVLARQDLSSCVISNMSSNLSGFDEKRKMGKDCSVWLNRIKSLI